VNKDAIGFAGAGLAGAVLARELAERGGVRSVLFESRDHIAGNCHTRRDPETGVMVHVYGPHIFNTNRERVWKYLNRFTTFGPYTHHVKAVTERGVFGLPINLLTINQFFGKNLSPKEAREFVAGLGDSSIVEPKNFEEQALRFVGRELYEAFFKGYTIKQWGRHPREIPASVLARLPVRFNYDTNYHKSRWTGIPVDGYTEMIRRILDHPNIEVVLNTRATPETCREFRHFFWAGPIDGFFERSLGPLSYRTVYWTERRDDGDILGTTQINYTSADVPHTRMIEPKYFAPWETHERSIAFTEYSKETERGDVPYYPLSLASDRALFARYEQLAASRNDVTFVGRLGTYRYLDMDKVVDEMIDLADRTLEYLAASRGVMPALSTDVSIDGSPSAPSSAERQRVIRPSRGAKRSTISP
jgi:UDP-galactopyranose mutase